MLFSVLLIGLKRYDQNNFARLIITQLDPFGGQSSIAISSDGSLRVYSPDSYAAANVLANNHPEGDLNENPLKIISTKLSHLQNSDA